MKNGDVTHRWTIEDAAEQYDVQRWGQDYFSIAENGHLSVHPRRCKAQGVDLYQLVKRLGKQGLKPPVLLRFNGILDDRLHFLHGCFARAIDEYEYENRYRCLFPIKVNPQCQVVEQIIRCGQPFGFGLEVGSKPELLATIASTPPDMPIVCNGFKDDAFIELALTAQKLRRWITLVIEKESELEGVLKHAKAIGVRPRIGFRVKLASRGSGRWQASGGYRSKFGLTVADILDGFSKLEAEGMADCCQLLHFHLGSQITNIRQVKSAVNEAARVYAALYKRGAGLRFLDVGGGLGVDYDGSQTNYESSMNYTTQEYANDVVYHIKAVCDDAQVPHPEILSESGRAITAHHCILIVETLGVTRPGDKLPVPGSIDTTWEQPVQDLWYALNDITTKNAIETFHDVQTAWENAMNLFNAGYLSLEQRVLGERMYFKIGRRIEELTHLMEFVPEELRHLDRMLSDMYFCNFSLFQSIPDSWAIRQLFPVMPIHRLEQRPTCHAVLGDITCDSDGKIDSFIDRRDVKHTLHLHPYDGSPYYLGVFLVGAYQEILGDLHNLFGDPHAVHIDLDEATGDTIIGTTVSGDSINEVLHYVQYDCREIVGRLQQLADEAIGSGLIDSQQATAFVKLYEDSLEGYTYLNAPKDKK